MRTFAIGTLLVAAAFGWTIGGGHWSATPHAARAPVPAPAPVDDWRSPRSSAGTIVIPRGQQGHFFVGGDVAGQHLNFIVDTGATTVAISRNDAKSVGVDVDHLLFDHQSQTASGTVAVAETTLPRLRIGDIQLLDVRAVVIDVPDGMALLGQSFLDRIDKVSIEGDKMTLTKL